MRTLILFLFSCMLALSAGEIITIPAMTPVFASEDCSKQPVGFTRNDLRTEILEHKTVYYRSPPLEKKIEMLRLKEGGWCTPKLSIQQKNGKPVLCYQKSQIKLFLSGCLMIFSLISAYLFLTKQKYKLYSAAAAIVLFHCSLVLFFTGCADDVLVAPLDETGYFTAAKGLSTLDFSGKWFYTIGFPIIMIPMILLTGAASYDEIDLLCASVNAYILMSAVLFAAFLILRKLFASDRKAFCAVMLWQITTIFLQFRDFWGSDPFQWTGNLCKSWVSLPVLEQSYNLYTKYIWLGFNGLSDPLSTLLVFLCILLMLSEKRRIFLIALLFGFSCLTRINNIFFAPLLAGILFWQEPGLCRKYARLLKIFLTGATGFFLIFSMQLFVNRIQFGSIFSLPYVLHAQNVQQGFDPALFFSGMNFLLKANWLFFAAGTAALLTIRDQRIRTFFALWIIPVSLFFFGYPQAGNNGIRFILSVYAPLCGAFVFASPKTAYLPVTAGALLTAPSGYFWTKYLPWGLERFSFGATVCSILNILLPLLTLIWICCCWKREIPYFLLAFTILYYSGLPILLCAAMVFVLLRAGYDLFRRIKKPDETLFGF